MTVVAGIDELHFQCERRGWRLRLTGNAHYPDGTPGPNWLVGMLLDGLEVRGRPDDFFGRQRQLLARVRLDPLAGPIDYDHAALELARALESQGLIP